MGKKKRDPTGEPGVSVRKRLDRMVCWERGKGGYGGNIKRKHWGGGGVDGGPPEKFYRSKEKKKRGIIRGPEGTGFKE